MKNPSWITSLMDFCYTIIEVAMNERVIFEICTIATMLYPKSSRRTSYLHCTTMYILWCKIENDSTPTSFILIIPGEQWDRYLEEYAWVMRDNDFDRRHRQWKRMLKIDHNCENWMSHCMPWMRWIDDQFMNLYESLYQICRSSWSNTTS
jgi:hypothetical protein